MPSLPTGTVTFLFADIEGSTRLLQQLGDRFADVLTDYRHLLRTAIREMAGKELDTQGDSLFAGFPRARDALTAAVSIQSSILRHPWPDGVSLRARIGLHTGEALAADVGYVGMDVHRAARICAGGHGGQILLSDTTYALVAKSLPEGVSLRDLGEHLLKDLAHPHRLFQVMAAGLPTDFPPLKSLDVLPNNLPTQLTSFIGRAREIAEVKSLLATARLVTLTGSGGAGKTRLALQVAAEIVEGYPDGVWLAELAPIADPALVPKTVASALNVPEQPGRGMVDTLLDALRSKAVLLVLDNCEHLRAACRDLVATLLRASPQVRILATSREGLGVPGETLWRVPSLSLPEDIRHLPSSQELVLYDAVRLFVERAVAIAPGFMVTSENAPAVAQVCQRLDGIPLAIELAAARAKVLAVEQIAARLNDRFRLLTGGSAVALPRHQTLRAAIDWSYGLLSQQERTVLSRLSVFAGGWTLEAAEAVCAGGTIEASDILDLLTQLVDKSLVGVSMRGGEARYGLLETVREYGREKLQEAADVAELRRRHFDWYLALAETAEPELYGPHEDLWGERLELEHDNLRFALDWGMTNAAHEEAVLRLAGALGSFWNKRTHVSEGRAWLERALPGRGATPDVRAKALGFAGVLARLQGDYPRAAALGRESLDLRLKSEDKRGIAVALMQLGVLADYRGDPAEAKRLFAEAFAHFQEVGDKWGISSALNNLGEVARGAGDYDAARSFYEKSLSMSREVGNSSGIANAVGNLGAVSLHQGNNIEAATLLRSALISQRRLGDRKNIIGVLGGLAALALVESKLERAARLLGAAEALRERIGVLISPADRVLYEHQVGFARSALSEDAFASAWAEGRTMTMEQAIEYALQEVSSSPQ